MIALGRHLPLHAVRVFEAAARQGSFTAAAHELCVTHGAVSRQIKTLETFLGIELFKREHRRVVLTEAGQVFLPYVHRALELLELGAAHVSPMTRQGPLVVSCLGTFLMRWLIPRLYRFQELHPDIDVQLMASYLPVNFGAETADVMIRVGQAPWPNDLVVHPFLDEQVGPVCHPDMVKRSPIRVVKDLDHHVHLHTRTRMNAWESWYEAMGREKSIGTKDQYFDHFYFALQAASSGLGVALTPYPLVEDDMQSRRLTAPLGFIPSGLSYYVAYPPRYTEDQHIRAFCAWLLEEVA